MALLQRSSSSAMYRPKSTATPSRTSLKCSARAHRARSSQCTTKTFAAAPTSKASMPTTLVMESNATYSSWSASALRLTSTQTSVALLFSALVLTVAAEGGFTGLLILTALVMGYMYPAKVMSFASMGYRVLQAVSISLPAALGLKTHVQSGATSASQLKISQTSTVQLAAGKAASELPTGCGLASTASKPTHPEVSASNVDVKALLNPAKDKPTRAKTQSVTAFKSDSNAAKHLTAFKSGSNAAKHLTAFKSDSNAAKHLTASKSDSNAAKHLTAFKSDSNAAKDLTAFKSDSNAAKHLTTPQNKTLVGHVIKTLTASENNTSVGTNLTAFEDKMNPAKTPNVTPTGTKGENLQAELTKANLSVGLTGSTVDLMSYVSEQLAKPASFRGMSINALCVELPPRDLSGRVRPEDFKHRGAITVSTNDPDTFARKIAVQRQWEEQAEGGDLPRLSISSLSEVFDHDWTALKLYVATTLDWGVNGPKAVTWGDMRVVAAFGIAAGAVQAPKAEGKGAASTAGMLAEAEAVCEGEGQVVVLGHAAAAGVTGGNTGLKVPSTHSVAGSAAVEAAAGTAAARLAVPAAVRNSAGGGSSLKKGVKKGFGGKLLGVAKAMPFVAAVLVTKASMLLGGV